MKRLTLIPWLILLSACTLPFGVAPAAPPAAPTPTTLGVALPPVWTPTPPSGAAPTTVRPTSRPELEPTSTPEIEVIALRLTDLPGGYSPSQPISYGLSPAILSAGVLQPQAIAMFSEPGGTLVISVAALIGTPAEEEGFARWIETPTTLIEVLGGVLGQIEGSPRVLEGYSEIGDASAAAEGTIEVRDLRYTTQVVLLRQGPAAAYIAVLVPRGAKTGFNLQDLVHSYSERLRAGIESAGAPTPPAP